MFRISFSVVLILIIQYNTIYIFIINYGSDCTFENEWYIIINRSKEIDKSNEINVMNVQEIGTENTIYIFKLSHFKLTDFHRISSVTYYG